MSTKTHQFVQFHNTLPAVKKLRTRAERQDKTAGAVTLFAQPFSEQTLPYNGNLLIKDCRITGGSDGEVHSQGLAGVQVVQ